MDCTLNNVVVSVENGQIVIFFQVQLTIARNQQLRHRSTCEKKISKHARSNAHLTATKVLKEQQNRQIQSSTGLSVAQHRSATEKCLRTSYYIAKENRPYLDYENLVTLQQKNGVNLGMTLHSRWSCTEMMTQLLQRCAKISSTKLLRISKRSPL